MEQGGVKGKPGKEAAESTCPYRLNALLPDDIAVQKIFEVTGETHARFDATERTYEYQVSREKNPFYMKVITWKKISFFVLILVFYYKNS